MQDYDSIDALWEDAVVTVLNHGRRLNSRDGFCIEVIGWQGRLTNLEHTFLRNPVRNADPIYASAELLWYLKGTQRIEMIQAYAKQYSRFAEYGEAHGAYGHRWFKDNGFNQIASVIQLLKSKPSTRQAVISMWNANDLIHSIVGYYKDIPCTLSMQFLLRQDELDLIVTMRSNDLYLGMPYDVYCFTCIQRIVADSLGVKPNNYIHQVGSLHIYDRNYDKIMKAVESTTRYEPLSHNWEPFPWNDEAIFKALQSEEDIRVRREWTFSSFQKNVIGDSLALCAAKWYPPAGDLVSSEVLRDVYYRRTRPGREDNARS